MSDPLPNSVSRISRRALLASGGALAAALACPALIRPAVAHHLPRLRNGEILPSPNLDEGRIGHFAGIRPYRPDGIRLEAERIASNRFIIHNYGHGGAGITLAWGSAKQAISILEGISSRVGRLDSMSIGIVGAGIIGLTLAQQLRRKFRNMPLTIYAHLSGDQTTSWVAGGQFAPAGMAGLYRTQLPGRQQTDLHKLVNGSFEEARRLRAAGSAAAYGIFERFNYTITKNDSFESAVPRAVIPSPNCGRLPFDRLREVDGHEYKTMLIDPTTLMPRLTRDLEGPRFQFVRRYFGSANEVRGLDHRVIFNCTGFGARDLFGDTTMIPIRGQIARFQNRANLRYFFSENCDVSGPQPTYLFCRRADIVVGGTYERHVADPRPVARDCDRLVARMKEVFRGNVKACHDPMPGFVC